MTNLRFKLSVICVALQLSACAELQKQTGMDDKTTNMVGGAALGCAAGALIARSSNQNSGTGCAAGAVIGALVGFEMARQAELAAAEQTRKDAIAAFATLPRSTNAKAVVVGDVKTVEVTATDKATKQTKKYNAFDSISIDMPSATKGTPEYELAMGKVRALADRVAAERGVSDIIIGVNGVDAKKQKIALSSSASKGANGGIVNVTKRIDTTLATGMQRVTVKAGQLVTEV